MSDWYSFPTYNPYSPSSPYVSNNGMMPTPNDLAAARLRTMGGGGGYRNDPSQFDQNAYAGRMAGLGALGATMAYPPLGLAAAGYGALAPTTAGEADARTTNKDLEALRLNAQNQREAAKLKADQDARDRQKEIDDANARKADAVEATRQLNQWRVDNADRFGKLAQPYQDAIQAATSLEEAKGHYKAGQDAYKEASQTLVEKYPTQMAWGELGAGALGFAVPAVGRLARTLGLWNATRKAENAFDAALGPNAPAEASQGALNAVARTGNQLAASVKSNTQQPGIGGWLTENVGHTPEMVGGTIAPWTFGNLAPNTYDYMMGSLASDPGGQEKAQKAWEHAWDPHRGAFAGSEGLAASILGGWLSGIVPRGNLMSRAEGMTNTLQSPTIQRQLRGSYPAQEVPMDLGGWSTPNVTQLYGGPAAAVRRKADRGGYTPVLEGR